MALHSASVKVLADTVNALIHVLVERPSDTFHGPFILHFILTIRCINTLGIIGQYDDEMFDLKPSRSSQ